MSRIRLSQPSPLFPAIGVLAVTALLAACGRRGTESEEHAAEQGLEPSSGAASSLGDVTPEKCAAPELLVAPFNTEDAKAQQRAWAEYLGVSAEITNSIGMKLALIPAGEFVMGSPETEIHHRRDEYQHRVRITKPFYLGVYEVTQAEYENVMGENPSQFKGALNPVEQVSWDDATEFCKRLSAKEGKTYRLPTEAEWEYACRAGTTTQYGFVDDAANLGEYAWYSNNSDDKTHPVGEKTANAWRLHDMLGNVWEWCADRWDSDYYSVSPKDDPPGPETGSGRVFRGGNWWVVSTSCRAAYRDGDAPQYEDDRLGFRVAADPRGGQPGSSR